MTHLEDTERFLINDADEPNLDPPLIDPLHGAPNSSTIYTDGSPIKIKAVVLHLLLHYFYFANSSFES
jgi:hypothetical protein